MVDAVADVCGTIAIRQLSGSQPNQVQVMNSGRERWTCQDGDLRGPGVGGVGVDVEEGDYVRWDSVNGLNVERD